MTGAPTTIRAVLATVPYTGWHLAELRAAFDGAEFVHADWRDDAAIAEALTYVDVAVLKADLDARFLTAPKLKWVHCDHSGLNRSALPEVFERGLMVTGSAGRAAPALAHHAFFFILSLVYEGPALYDEQRQHSWRGLPSYRDLRGVYGKTLGVVGLGHTGAEVAALAKAFGMRVLGYGKRADVEPPNLDRYYSAEAGDGLDGLLSESDFVVLTVRLTDRTRGMIGEPELTIMKPTARLINLARGPVVDEAALVTALHDGTIAGAGLDVFEQEPLPADAAVWDAPNTVLTPHVTAEMPDLTARSLEIISENARRYRAGHPLLNLLTPDDVYTEPAPAARAGH